MSRGWQKEKGKPAEQGVVVSRTDPQLATEHVSQYASGLLCRYSPGPVAGKAVNFQLQHSSPLQSHNPLVEEQDEEGLLTDPTEKRFVPHLSAPLVTVFLQPRSRPAGHLVPPAPQSPGSRGRTQPGPATRAEGWDCARFHHRPCPEPRAAVPQQQGRTDRDRAADPALLQGT